MSKHINVNPDHYKVAGRERQGEAVNQTLQRQQFAQQQAQTERWRAKQDEPPWEATASEAAEAEGGRARPRGGRAKAAGRKPKGEARRQADRKLKGQKTQRRLKGPKARRLKGQRVRASGVAANRLQPAAARTSSKKRSPARRRRTSRPASQHKRRR